RDRLRDVLDGQVAGDGPLVAVALDAGGVEGDARVGLDVEEVGRLQVAVAVGGRGVHGGGLDGDLHRGVGGVGGVDVGRALEAGERATHVGDHRVAGLEAEAAVARVDRVVAGQVGDRLGGGLEGVVGLVALEEGHLVLRKVVGSLNV